MSEDFLFENDKRYGFFAMLDRMAYINRWGLMKNSRFENLKEHSFDVAVIAHALCVLHNKINEDIEGAVLPDPYKVQALALYHDCTEIITGDLPTPIKYKNEQIKAAYREVENDAANTLAGLLPNFMQDDYIKLLAPDLSSEEQVLCKKLVKAADRIAAYLKCLSERISGNCEFSSAQDTIRESIERIDLPEVRLFMERFVPSYGLTLDEISN
ncbi:MAG TPA: 5'-deoxynucleotidase [Saccharofermentans sp.]|nr:5'-deoxynucleotidase [Saccharofermentans sp.]HPQ32533.1 5'-deoxynucleotidase [Saccharofermentans sp.]